MKSQLYKNYLEKSKNPKNLNLKYIIKKLTNDEFKIDSLENLEEGYKNNINYILCKIALNKFKDKNFDIKKKIGR